MAERFDAKRLNLQRGSGLGSRMAASPSKLPDGWRFERRSAKSCVWSQDYDTTYPESRKLDLSCSIACSRPPLVELVAIA